MSRLTQFIAAHQIEWYVDGDAVVILDHLCSVDGSYITELCRVHDLHEARLALGY
jgi:hypothetical protein